MVAGERELIDGSGRFAVLHGASASPFDAMNGLRGIRTLPVRIARQSDTAQRLAEVLEGHPAVACTATRASRRTRSTTWPSGR